MAIYAIVFKTKDNKQVVLSAMNDGYSHFFSNYKDAVKSLSSVVKSLEHLLDGEPERVGNMLRGYKVVRKVVSDEDREKWSGILETLEIKKVSGITLTDGTEISKEGGFRMKYKVIKDFYMEYKEVPEYTVNQVFDFVLRDGRIVMPDDGHGVPHYFDYDDEFLEHFELVDEQTP